MGAFTMTTCAFFGHADTPDSVRPALRDAILTQLTKDPCTNFLVGHQGRFDGMAYHILKEIMPSYPQMRFSIVLAYTPGKRHPYDNFPYEDTILWDGIESTPKRYAIARRNAWLVQQCDMVICYINRETISNSAKYVAKAQRMGKPVINICHNQ